MASLDKLKNILPAYYSLSNKNLIIIAHVRDETIYFYDELGPTTTIVLLSQPKCYQLKKIFLDFMNDLGTTVIDLQEEETFHTSYTMTKKSTDIINTLLKNFNYEKVLTLPQYNKNNDPQNTALYNLVSKTLKQIGKNNLFTYKTIGKNDKPTIPCKNSIKEGIIQLYSSSLNDDFTFDKYVYNNYMSITSKISGTKHIDIYL
jgi:hypothetical protein